MWYWFATSEDSIVNLPAALKASASHITWCPEAAFLVVQKLLVLSTCNEITFPLKSAAQTAVSALHPDDSLAQQSREGSASESESESDRDENKNEDQIENDDEEENQI